MNPSFFYRFFLSFLLLFKGLVSAELSHSVPKSGWSEITFAGTFPQADAEEVKWRLHSVENPGNFDVRNEQFRLFVPPGIPQSEPLGVLVWVDSGNAPQIPTPWEKIFTARRLLCVCALRSGNSRNIFDRMRMALHASYGIRTRFKVDESRIYVSGFSGGARVASMLGVAWPDLFSGSVSFMGANFYTEIPSSNGKIFAPSFIPDDQALAMAKKDSRHVLVTSEKDFNRAEIFSVYENGYRKEKFRAVTLLEVPQLGHSIPDSSWLEKALLFLDGARH